MKLLILFFTVSFNPFISVGTLLPFGSASEIMKSGGYIETGLVYKKGSFYISGNIDALNFSFLGSGKTSLNMLGITPRMGVYGEKIGLKWFSIHTGLPLYRANLQNQSIRTTSIIVGFSIGASTSFSIKGLFCTGLEMEYVNFPGKVHNWEYVKLGLNFSL